MKLTVRLALLPLALALGVAPEGARAAAPPGVQWVADVTPDPSISYPVNSAHRLADGTVLVLESMFLQGVTASHLDANGAVLSTRELPLPSVYGGNWMFAVDPSGAVFVGLTAAPRPLEAWVMKFDGLTGRALWPGPFHYRPEPQTDTLFRALALDGHGNLFVTALGSSQTSAPFLFSLDGATGGILWGPVSHADPATPGLTFFRVAVDANGDAVVSGSWGDQTGALGQIEAFKFDGRTGALLWGPTLVPAGSAGPDSDRYAELDANGDLVIAGQRTEGTLYRPVVVKIAGADGSILWGPLIPIGTGTSFAAVNLLRVDSRGDVLLGALLPGGAVPTLLKVAGRDGAAVWGPIPYPGDASAFTFPVAAAVEPNGDLFETFSERKSNPITHAAATVRIDGATGSVIWGPVVLATAGVSGGLLLDSGGGVLLAVTTIDPQNSNVVGRSEVVFYSGATGATTRGPMELPPSARSATAVRVAVDASGDVVSLGRLTRAGTDRAALVKYRGTSGSILWGPIEMPVDIWGSPVDLKLAANGDPIWIGTRESSPGVTDIVALRHSASTGSPVWGPVSLSGAGQTTLRAVALGLDGNDDVFVLGESRTFSSDAFVTLKWNGTTGALLWGPTLYNAGGGAFPTALAVSPAGDVAVTGWSSGDGVALQYSGSSGTLAWGPVFQAISSSSPAVAVDASNDVILAGSTVIKRRGTDGSILWGPISLFDTSGGFLYSTTSLALDTAGNPVIGSFTSDGVTLRRETLVSKFDHLSGTRLWGPVTWDASQGSGPRDVFFVAVDSSGDVVVAANGINDAYGNMVVRKYSGANGTSVWGPVSFDGPGLNYLMSMTLFGNDPVLAGSASWGSMRTVRFGFAFSLETQAWQVPPALCGRPYQFAFQTRNGVAPLAFSITSGALPAGLALDPVSGVLAGTTGPTGTYSFRVRVGSGAASVERDYTMVVVDGQPVIDIVATPSTLCAGDGAVLSVPGVYSSYLWLPSGETTSSIAVSPGATTTYDFVGTTASGCIQRGSRTVTVFPAPTQPSIFAPSVVAALADNLLASVADHPGSHYVWSIARGAIVSGQGTHEIRFGAGVGGDLTLTVVETSGNGCPTTAATFTTQVTPVTTRFFPVPPCRIYDSRSANLPFVAGEVRRLTLAGLCGIPPTARAVAMNVTAVGVSGGGSLSTAPGGIAGAAAAGPSWSDAETRAASAIMGVSAAGAVDISCQAVSGSAHLVIDVAGYFE